MHLAEEDIRALIDGADEEASQEFWRIVSNYTLQIIYPAMMFGFWAGATMTTEAVGGALNPIPGTNLNWTIARNLVRISIERGRARH